MNRRQMNPYKISVVFLLIRDLASKTLVAKRSKLDTLFASKEIFEYCTTKDMSIELSRSIMLMALYTCIILKPKFLFLLLY